MLLVLVSTVRITPPPTTDTDIVPRAEAAQKAGLPLPAFLKGPQADVTDDEATAQLEPLEQEVGCAKMTLDVQAVAEAAAEAVESVEAELVVIRGDSGERALVRTIILEAGRVLEETLTIDASDCGTVERVLETAVPAARRTIRVRAALPADADTGCS